MLPLTAIQKILYKKNKKHDLLLLCILKMFFLKHSSSLIRIHDHTWRENTSHEAKTEWALRMFCVSQHGDTAEVAAPVPPTAEIKVDRTGDRGPG